MYRKKKISNVSEPTQTSRPKRFTRQNSYCSLDCRSKSVKKLSLQKDPRQIIPKDPEIPIQLPLKHQTQSMKYQRRPLQQASPKKYTLSGSMKYSKSIEVDEIPFPPNLLTQFKQKTLQNEEVLSLKRHNKKLKIYFNQQRQKRKHLEEEVRLNKQEIKRLEKRVGKYKSQNQDLKKQRQNLLNHIQDIENTKMTQEMKNIRSYQVKYMQEQANRLKLELQKSKSTRQRQLIRQMDKLIQQKYTVEKQLNAAIVAKNAFNKQIEDLETQIEQIQITARQKVIRSVEYLQLRQRYRMNLVETKWLKQEVEHLQKQNRTNEQAHQNQNITSTLLTISVDSLTTD